MSTTLDVISDDAMNRRDTAPVAEERLHETAHFLLELRALGSSADAALVRDVGPSYADNAVVATLSALDHHILRPRDLHDFLGLPTPTISRIVDRLEASGDLERRTGEVPDDHRAILLAITGVGRRRARAIARAVIDDTAAVSASAKRCLSHLERLLELSPTSPALPVAEDAAGNNVCGALGLFGLRTAETLRNAAGDNAGALALASLVVGEGHGRPSTVADAIGLTSGGTTKLLDRLQQQGYLRRAYGPDDDRRAVELTLTPEGRSRMHTVTELMAPHLPALRQPLADIIDQLRDHTG